MINATGRRVGWAIVGLMAVSVGVVVSVSMVWANDGQMVGDARLLGAADRDRLSFGQDYRNQRFSALDQIDRETVARLQPAWIYQTGVLGSFQTTPLVVDGVMYVTMPGNDMAAIDAGSGEEIWRYRHELRAEPFGPLGNRGAAVGYGKIYQATEMAG